MKLPLSLSLGAMIALIALIAPAASAQVVRDLDSIRLEYTIRLKDDPVPIGSADFSFEPVDTERGRRLIVKSKIEYTVMLKSPFHYVEEAELTCDEEGPVEFETSARAGGLERKNTALRVGEEYQVSTEFDGKSSSKSITASVQRTNLGLFCAGFLKESLTEGPMFEDYPLLFPVGGDHQPRQRFREAQLRVTVAPELTVPAVITSLKKLDKKPDRYWHTNDKYQVLLRLEEQTAYGLMTYELTAVNGVPPAESDILP